MRVVYRTLQPTKTYNTRTLHYEQYKVLKKHKKQANALKMI
jgi:hypothetical protein